MGLPLSHASANQLLLHFGRLLNQESFAGTDLGIQVLLLEAMVAAPTP